VYSPFSIGLKRIDSLASKGLTSYLSDQLSFFTGLPMTGQGKEEVNSLLLLKV
jgi:hypothetical protein